jgi:bacillolysin
LWFERYRHFLKLSDPRSQLRIESVQTDRLGSTHVKLGQVVDAVPVWNRTVAVHYNQDHALYLFQGDYVPSSTLLNVDTSRAMPVSEAAAVALAAVSEDASQWKVEDSFLVIHTAESRSPRPAHVLILSKGLMERYRYIVDALNGDILDKSSLVRTGMQPMQLK